jgi:membrane protease YdiL (CAAX protease family)
MNQSKTRGTSRVASTKRLLFVWLFSGIIEWAIQYLNQWLSPSTAADNLGFEAVIGDVCAVLFFLWKWPQMFATSRFRPCLGDLAVGIPLGYLMTNITGAILGKSAFCNDWMLTNPQRKLTFICAVLIVPLAEEITYRGAILGSLLEKTSLIWAVLITTAAATIMHDSWRVAFPDQILLCTAYLSRRRSLPASIIAHAVANAAIFAPSLLIVFHIMK